jgi:hypothetical protein
MGGKIPKETGIWNSGTQERGQMKGGSIIPEFPNNPVIYRLAVGGGGDLGFPPHEYPETETGQGDV